MDAMTFTAGQLQARQPAATLPHAVNGRSHAEDIRVLLEERGPQTARVLGNALDLPPSRIGALLKWDLKIGRIAFHDGVYQLAPDWRPRQAVHLERGQELVTWHAVDEQLPDADLTVNVATQGCEEPVWLGHFDGETWRDVDGMEIHVTHWAEMLRGPL